MVRERVSVSVVYRMVIGVQAPGVLCLTSEGRE